LSRRINLVKRFRRLYGANPLHLLSVIAMLAFVGYVLVQIFDGLYPWNLVLWFVGAIVAHDLIAYPLYTTADLIAGRGAAAVSGQADRVVPVANFLRVPAIVSGILFVVWFPLILGLSADRYEGATGQSVDPYLPRWLFITAALFGLSALTYAWRLRRARRATRPM
jgi:hypothetical protein